MFVIALVALALLPASDGNILAMALNDTAAAAAAVSLVLVFAFDAKEAKGELHELVLLVSYCCRSRGRSGSGSRNTN